MKYDTNRDKDFSINFAVSPPQKKASFNDPNHVSFIMKGWEVGL